MVGKVIASICRVFLAVLVMALLGVFLAVGVFGHGLPPPFAWPLFLGLAVAAVFGILMAIFDPSEAWIRMGRLDLAAFVVSVALMGIGFVLMEDRLFIDRRAYADPVLGQAKWEGDRRIFFSYSRDYFGDKSGVRRVGRMDLNPIRVDRDVYLVWSWARIEVCVTGLSGRKCAPAEAPEWLRDVIAEGERQLTEARRLLGRRTSAA